MNQINLGRCISVLNRRSQLFLVEACERLQLTYSEYMMLMRLYDAEGLSQEALASLLCLDKAVVARTVTLLEKKDLVRREKDAQDRRVKHVYLTERGLQEKAFLQGLLTDWVEFLLDPLTKEQIEEFSNTLQKIFVRVNEANIHEMARKIEVGVTERIS